MKQTNNAIKFLMAQYRAIFKHAYFKGITSAVLLTTALGAASTANATITWGDANDTDVDVVISGTEQESGGKDVFAHDLNITGSLTLSGSSSRIVVNNNMTLASGAQLTIDSSNAKSGIQGSNDIANPDVPSQFKTANTLFDATGATIKVDNSSIQFVNVDITDSTVTLDSGGGIGAYAGQNYASNRGVMNIDGTTTLTMNSGSWVFGNHVNIGSGVTVNFNGDSETATVGQTAGGLAEIYSSGENNSLTVAGTVTVADQKYGRLGGAKVELNDGAVITNSGTMSLGTKGEGNTVSLHDGATLQIDTKSTGHIWVASDFVMDGGVLKLDNTSGSKGFGMIANTNGFGTADYATDFTATSGEIEVTKSQIQFRNVTLGGDVVATIGTNIEDDDDSNFADNSQITAIGSDDSTGIMTIDGATINMNEASLLTYRQLDFQNGTIYLNGTDDATTDSNSGSSMLRGYGSGITNLNGGNIVVGKNTGVIRSKDINLAGSTLSISESDTLTLGGAASNDENGSKIAAAADFDMTAGTLTNGFNSVLGGPVPICTLCSHGLV